MAERIYDIDIKRESCTLNRLSLKSDPGGINLTHRSTLTAFGALAYTRRDEPARMAPSDLPANVEAVHLPERRAYAPMTEQSADRVVGHNPATGHTITYELGTEGFDLWLEGEMPFADQVGLDLDVAFMDVDQDAPEQYQFLPICPYTSADRSVSYVYLSRPTGPGMLIVALTPALWRLRYGRGGFGEAGWVPWAYSAPLHAILGLQMLARVDSALEPDAQPGPIRQGIRVRFPETLQEARRYMAREMGMPLLSAPTLGCEAGDALKLAVSAPATGAKLIDPAGDETPVTLDQVDEDTQAGTVVPRAEGFYTVKAWNAAGYTSDLTIRCGADWLRTLRRSVEGKPPVASFNAEGQFWAHAMAMARAWFGADDHWDRCLYDMLVRVHMQGVPAERLPEMPAGEPTDLPAQAKTDEKGIYLRSPWPEPHQHLERTFSPYHMYKNDRLQDAATLIELFLLGADAYGEEAFYEQAVRMAEAIVADNIEPSGRMGIVNHHNPLMTHDYTTVMPPLQHLVQLWTRMARRGDPRADGLEGPLLRVGDHLVERGFEFPTEGVFPHQRWTEDGSIACTALSLLYLYWHVEQKPAYWKAAQEILAFYEKTWGIDAPDVRMLGSSFRYWETQWENDQEGRAINAGHPWTLWRAEALYWDAMVSRSARRLLSSYNGYWSNRCKFMADGSTYSCFTPDYIPDRPRRFALTHRYPQKTDPCIAYYLWPRAAETWFRTAALVSARAAECDFDTGEIALNGRLERDDDGSRLLRPQAPAFDRFFLLSSDDQPVRVEADRPITALSDAPLRVLRGRAGEASALRGTTVEPENGAIELARRAAGGASANG